MFLQLKWKLPQKEIENTFWQWNWELINLDERMNEWMNEWNKWIKEHFYDSQVLYNNDSYY